MWKGVGLALVGQAASLDKQWTLQNGEAHLGFEIYDTSYTASFSERCSPSEVIDVSYSGLNCYTKCVTDTDSTCHSSSAFARLGEPNAPYHFNEGTLAVCGSTAQIQALADTFEESDIWGYYTDMEDGDNLVAYLVSSCASPESTSESNRYARGLINNHECQLGYGAQIVGGEAKLGSNDIILERSCPNTADADYDSDCVDTNGVQQSFTYAATYPYGSLVTVEFSNDYGWTIKNDGTIKYVQRSDIAPSKNYPPSPSSGSIAPFASIGSWYDVDAFDDSWGTAKTDVKCDAPAGWHQWPQHYCQDYNRDTKYNSVAEIVNHGCYNKCWADVAGVKTQIFSNRADLVSSVNGESLEFCGGNDATFTADTNAICLPAQQCMNLALSLGDTSLDIHTFKPVCYINEGNCDAVSSFDADTSNDPVIDMGWSYWEYSDPATGYPSGTMFPDGDKSCEVSTSQSATCSYKQYMSNDVDQFEGAANLRDTYDIHFGTTCRNLGSSVDTTPYAYCSDTGSNADCQVNMGSSGSQQAIDLTAYQTFDSSTNQNIQARLSASLCQAVCSSLSDCASVVVEHDAGSQGNQGTYVYDSSQADFIASRCWLLRANMCWEGTQADIGEDQPNWDTSTQGTFQDQIMGDKYIVSSTAGNGANTKATNTDGEFSGLVQTLYTRNAASECYVDVSGFGQWCDGGDWIKYSDGTWRDASHSCKLEFTAQGGQYQDVCAGWSLATNQDTTSQTITRGHCVDSLPIAQLVNNFAEDAQHLEDVEHCSAWYGQDSYSLADSVLVHTDSNSQNSYSRVQAARLACGQTLKPFVTEIFNAGETNNHTVSYQTAQWGLYGYSSDSGSGFTFSQIQDSEFTTEPDWQYDTCYDGGSGGNCGINGGNFESAAAEYYNTITVLTQTSTSTSATPQDPDSGQTIHASDVTQSAVGDVVAGTEGTKGFVGCFDLDTAYLGSYETKSTTVANRDECHTWARSNGYLYSVVSYTGDCYGTNGNYNAYTDSYGELDMAGKTTSSTHCNCAITDAAFTAGDTFSSSRHGCVHFAFSRFWNFDEQITLQTATLGEASYTPSSSGSDQTTSSWFGVSGYPTTGGYSSAPSPLTEYSTPCNQLVQPYQVKGPRVAVKVDPCFSTGALAIDFIGYACCHTCSQHAVQYKAADVVTNNPDEARGGAIDRRRLDTFHFNAISGGSWNYILRDYHVPLLTPSGASCVGAGYSSVTSQLQHLDAMEGTWWEWEKSQITSLALTSACVNDEVCQESQSCLYSNKRFEGQYSSISSSQLSTPHNVQISSPDQADSWLRVDAYRRTNTDNQNVGEILQRHTPGAERVLLTQVTTATVEWMHISVTENTASRQHYFPDFTDTIDVSLHGSGGFGSSIAGTVSFTVYGCVPDGTRDSAVTAFVTGGTVVSVSSTGSCMHDVTIDTTTGDFSFSLAQYIDYCADAQQVSGSGANVCADEADCVSATGAGVNTCVCKGGYVNAATPAGTACVLDNSKLASHIPQFKFMLKHNDELHGGWRVNTIKMGANCDSDLSVVDKDSIGVRFGNYPATSTSADHSANQMGVAGSSNAWWSQYLELSHAADTNEQITWDQTNFGEIGCVEISQVEGYASSDLELIMSLDNADGLEVQRFKPTADSGTTARFVIECGVEGSQFFGEILSISDPDLSADLVNYGKFPAKTDNYNLNACQCQALATMTHSQPLVAHSWKLYTPESGPNSLHQCILTGPPFSPGAGYYGRGRGNNHGAGFAGWVSGRPGSNVHAIKARDAAGDDVAFAADVSLSVVLQGVNLVGSSFSKRFRAKIVHWGKACHVAPAEEVSGFGCSKTTKGDHDFFTLCSPKPNPSSDNSEIVFDNIIFRQQTTTTEYQVCYCDGRTCQNPSSWQAASIPIVIPGSTVKWTLHVGADTGESQTTIMRKTDDGTNQWTLVLYPETFAWVGASADWQVKIVSANFQPEVYMDSAKFNCGGSTHCASGDSGFNPTSYDSLSVTFNVDLDLEDVGEYQVVWRKSSSDDWQVIPEADGHTKITVTRIPLDTQVQPGAYHSQVFTAQAGATTPIEMVGIGMSSDISQGRLTLTTTDSCSSNLDFSFTKNSVTVPVGTAAPELAVESCLPKADATTVRKYSNIKVAFDQEIAKGSGYVILQPVGSSYVWNEDAFPCDLFDHPTASDASSTTGYTDSGAVPLGASSSNFNQQTGRTVSDAHSAVHSNGSPFFAFDVADAELGLDGKSLIFNILDAVEPVLDVTDAANNQCTWSLGNGATGVTSYATSQLCTGGNSCYQSGSSEDFNSAVEQNKWANSEGQGKYFSSFFTFTSSWSATAVYDTSFGNTNNIVGYNWYGTDTTVENRIGLAESTVYEMVVQPGTVYTTVDTVETPNNLIVSTDTYKFTASESGTPASEDKAQFIQGQQWGGNLYLWFSTSGITFGTTTFDLQDCGSEQDCKDQPFASQPAGSPTVLHSWVDGSTTLKFTDGIVQVPVHNLQDGHKYTARFADGFVLDAGSDSIGGFEFEFVYGSDIGLKYPKHTWLANPVSSNAGSLVFDLDLPSDIVDRNGVHAFTACYCSPQVDQSLNTEGVNTRFFRSSDDEKCDAGYIDITGAGVLSGVASDLCHTKCDKGSKSADSYCSDYSGLASADHNSALCVSNVVSCENLCRAQSEANEEWVNGATDGKRCIGFDYTPHEHGHGGTCYLHEGSGADKTTSSCTTATDEAFTSYSEFVGTPCTDPHDYDLKVGTVHVSDRILIGVNYVCTPGMECSIDVLNVAGKELTTLDAGSNYDTGISGDRITVIDCQGTCGVSSPSAAIEHADYDEASGEYSWNSMGSISKWNRLEAKNWYHDMASDADQVVTANAAPNYQWVQHAGSVCNADNSDVINITEMVTTNREPVQYGLPMKLSSMLCVNACARSRLGAGCTGWAQGKLDPRALCGDLTELQSVCAHIDADGKYSACAGLAFNSGRAFLYSECSNPEPTSDTYDVYVHTTTDSRRMSFSQHEWLYSWFQMLRFHTIRTNSGGTFKVCACDSKATANGRSCHHVSDYKFYGGLRCIDNQGWRTPTFPADTQTPITLSQETLTDPAISAFCLFGPEEGVRDHFACQIVSYYQSNTANWS